MPHRGPRPHLKLRNGDDMVIALFALSLAMIVGGLFSMIFGWDIVLVERGWTMVIAGSIMAASGALLLGVASILSRLTSIRAELTRLSAHVGGEPSAAIASRRLSEDTSDTVNPPFEIRKTADPQPDLPFLAPLPEIDRDPVPSPAFEGDRFAQDHPASLAAEPHRGMSDRGLSDRDPPDDLAQMKLPDFLLERNRGTSDESEIRDIRTRKDDFGDYEPGPFPSEPPAPVAEPVASAAAPAEPHPIDPLGPAVEHAPQDVDDVTAKPADALEGEPGTTEAAAPQQPAAIIGTYNSGDNHYVMYSDGSIEAETPQGNFRFGSLDELKEFIASGGEDAPRAP